MNDKKTEHEKMLDALLPGTVQNVELQVWPAMGGVQWVKQGYALFRQYPLRWLGALAVMVLVLMAVSVLPVVGNVLGALLNPVMGAGLMYFASRLATGREARFNDLFIGLRQRTGALVGLGAVNLCVTFMLIVILLMLAASTLGEEALTALAAAMEQEDMNTVQAILEPHGQSLLLSVLIVLALYLPVMAALWFAPPLILFKHCGVLAALQLSLKAFVRNFLPLTLCSLVLVGWVMLGSVVFSLLATVSEALAGGVLMGLAVLFVGVFVAVQWVSYAAIFPQADTVSPPTDGQADLLL